MNYDIETSDKDIHLSVLRNGRVATIHANGTMIMSMEIINFKDLRTSDNPDYREFFTYGTRSAGYTKSLDYSYVVVMEDYCGIMTSLPRILKLASDYSKYSHVDFTKYSLISPITEDDYADYCEAGAIRCLNHQVMAVVEVLLKLIETDKENFNMIHIETKNSFTIS